MNDFAVSLAWGAFGQDAPAAMRVFSGRGQPTREQLIDRYHIRCQPVRYDD